MKITLQFESLTPDDSNSLSDSVDHSIDGIRDHLFREGSLSREPYFVGRPEVLLSDYAARRGASPLGQVFRVANGLHDHIDAVVVIGCDEAIQGIRAITDACCDRYHNELSRAERGSKPRLYFAGSRCDNDATTSLLNRLLSGRKVETDAESRFAIVAIGYPGEEAGVEAALPYFMDALQKVLGDDVDEWLPRLVIPIGHQQSRVDKFFSDLELAASFELTSSDDPVRDALSPVGLLPAAFLGLDCMKLLEGAYAITKQFRRNDFQDNLVMQYTAAQHSFDGASRLARSVSNWNPALDSLEQWHHSLRWKWLRRHPQSPSEFLSEHWSVRACRTDPLFSDPAISHTRSLDEVSESVIQEAIEGNYKAGDPSASSVRGATRLTLPQIDTYGIGQQMQLLMLADYVSTHSRLDGESESVAQEMPSHARRESE